MENENDLIDNYFNLRNELHEMFEYDEDWRAIPLHDSRDFYWRLYGDGSNKDDLNILRFFEDKEILDSGGDYYEDDIYTQRFLHKWVYQSENFTMVCCDPHTDGNKFLRILDNKKRLEE